MLYFSKPANVGDIHAGRLIPSACGKFRGRQFGGVRSPNRVAGKVVTGSRVYDGDCFRTLTLALSRARARGLLGSTFLLRAKGSHTSIPMPGLDRFSNCPPLNPGRGVG